MRRCVSRWILAGAVALALTGCALVPIQNVNDYPVTSAATRPLSPQDVREAIVRAGIALGWTMKDDGPGRMVGTLMLREHTAVVEIRYSPATYSIEYRSSVQLNARDGLIHKRYNFWIANLTKGINAQLAAT